MDQVQTHAFLNVYDHDGMCLHQLQKKTGMHRTCSASSNHLPLFKQMIVQADCIDRGELAQVVNKINRMPSQVGFSAASPCSISNRWGYKHPIHVLDAAVCRGHDVFMSTGRFLLCKDDVASAMPWPVHTVLCKVGAVMVEFLAVQTPCENLPLLVSADRYCALNATGMMTATNHRDVQIDRQNSHRDTRLQTLQHFKQSALRAHLNVDTTLKTFHVSDVFVRWQCAVNATHSFAMIYFR